MKIIIAGAYDIGIYLATLLSHSHEDITLIDEDEERLDRMGAEADILSLQASPSSVKALKDAGTQHANLFIAVTPDQHLNLNICMIAKELGAKKTVAKIDDVQLTEPGVAELFERLGVSSLIVPEVLAATDIINGLKMSWVRQRWDVHNGALVMLGIKLREGCEILNQPLKQLCGPDDPYHVVAIKRGYETIIPGGNDELKLYDLAYFMTTRQYIPYIRKIVGKEHYVDVKNVLFMGGGSTCIRAVKNLPSYMEAKIIEKSEERCEVLNNELDENKALVIHGDGRDIQLLNEEGSMNTQVFVALTRNNETNILACLTAKRLGVRKTVAMVENMDYVSMADSLDIGTIVNKKDIAASHIYQMMLDADVCNVRFLTMANADVAEFTAQSGSKVTKKRVYELGLPKGVTIGGLVRNGVGVLVSGGTQIEAGDSVMVFCHNTNMQQIGKFFN